MIPESFNVEMRHKILVVDDETMNLMVLKNLLQNDYDLLLCNNGKEALHLARTERIDLIILDIIMPDMDGYEVCTQLKADPVTTDIPVVFITALEGENSETRGLSIGAIDYIAKPFSGAVLRARVKNHLELKRHRDILSNLSALDGLTGIPNRRRFDEYLQQEWRRARRNQEPLSVVFGDIDAFKAYNDNYGHGIGDQCLQQIARTLLKSLSRGSDLVARYGGEEFVCVLPQTDIVGAVAVAERLRKAVEDLHLTHEYSPISAWVTMSLGVAEQVPSAAEDDNSIAHLLRAADRNLYAAKHAGRNCVIPPPPAA